MNDTNTTTLNPDQIRRGKAIMIAKDALSDTPGIFAGAENKAAPSALITIAEYVIAGLDFEPIEPEPDPAARVAPTGPDAPVRSFQIAGAPDSIDRVPFDLTEEGALALDIDAGTTAAKRVFNTNYLA